MDSLRILMVGNICSTDVIAEHINKLGHDCDILITSRNPYEQKYDYKIIYDRNKKVECMRKMVRTAAFASNYDMVHWHSGIAKTRLDFLLMKLLYRKPVVINYHGSESREGYGMYYKTLADKKIVATPDILHWHPTGIYVPNPVPLYDYSFPVDATPRLVHLVTFTPKPERGTHLIETAIEELRGECTFEYRRIENVSHERALEEISQSHIVIDAVSSHINYQLYGVVSLEAMSMGKVVVCHIDDQYWQFFPGCPILSPEPNINSLKTILKGLIETPQGCRTIGRKGREYVQNHHDPEVIAKQLVAIYQEVLN